MTPESPRRPLGNACTGVHERRERRTVHTSSTATKDVPISLLSRIPPLERPRRQVALARLGTVLAATSLGALAVGAVAVGALAIRRLAIKTARIQRLEIDELLVGGRPFQPPA
jgi:hypothetical protein